MTNHHTETIRKKIVAAILSVGFISAIAVYLTAEAPADNLLVEQVENSKMYRRSLELYGGKGAILADKFTRWFESLWHGQPLAFTIAVLTLVAAVIYYVLSAAPSRQEQ